MVTVITPCFNSEKTIKKTIESVLNQTYQDIEYLIIDGASTDQTLEIAKSYKNAFKGRMHIYSEQDEGIYYAMNKGISLANGELIGIVNSDDYYETQAVEHMVSAFRRSNNPYQILYGFERLWEDGKMTSVILHNHENLPKQMITHPTCFVTKKLYEDKGVFNTAYRYSADYEFMLRMFDDCEVKFTPVYEIISNYALGGASGTDEAYLETMSLLHEYGSISEQKYKTILLRNRIGKIVRKFIQI